MNKWVAAAFLVGLLFGLSLGKLWGNDNATVSKNNTTSSTDALNLVEACARLNKTGQIYTRLTKERGVKYELLDTPGLSVLANMVDIHADQTGFSSRNCLSFEGFPEVMNALQGKAQSGQLVFKEGHSTGLETPKMMWCLNISLTNCLPLTREEVATIPQTIVSCSRSDGAKFDVNKPDTFLMIGWLSQDLPSDKFRCDPYG